MPSDELVKPKILIELFYLECMKYSIAIVKSELEKTIIELADLTWLCLKNFLK